MTGPITNRIPGVALAAAALSIAGIAFLGCSSGMQVQTDYDTAATFTGYHSYALHPKVEEFAKTSLNGRRFANAIQATMAEKGFVDCTDQSCDMLVMIHGGTQDKVQITNSTYGYRGWGGGVDAYSYTEGTLVIDIIDRAKETLVWRGTGTAIMGTDNLTDENAKTVVSQILKGFPPK